MSFYLNQSQFIPETKKEIDGNDFLIAYDVPIAKTGIQQYTREEVGDKDNSGSPTDLVNVYRDRSAFEDEEVLNTFDGIPIVYAHPKNGKVDSENYKNFIVGTISGVYFKNGDVFAKKITIIDKKAIKSVLRKEKNNVSIGFRGKLTKKSGTFQGENYQYIEDIIHANHLALCETGKAGERYAINSSSIMKGEAMGKDCENVDISELATKTSSSSVAKVKPLVNEEDEKMPEDKEELMENENDLEKKDKEDRDMMNALKSNNKKLQGIVSLKNSQIRKLEMENLELENTLIEARECMNEMASHFRSKNLVNAMTAPDSLSPNHPKNAQFSHIITSAFMAK